MKKIFLIVVLAAVSCLASYSQQKLWLDTLDLSEIVGDDTIVFYTDSLSFPLDGARFVADFRMLSLDDDDAVLTLGGDNWGFGFNQYVHDSIPYTLNETAMTIPVNGTNRASKGFYGDKWPYITFGIKVDPGAVTSGSLAWKIILQR